jgi:hypothetical protein
MVRKWIAGKTEPNEAFWSRWYFAGGTWRPSTGGREVVSTVRRIGTGTEEAPELWSLRFEHPCQEHPGVRTWRTDVGLQHMVDGHQRIAIAVTHRLHEGFIGDYPETPTPSAPVLIHELVGSPTWSAFAGSEVLTSRPEVLQPGDGKLWAGRLQDRMRTCPLVLVTKTRDTSETMVDSRRLARRLAGTAVVVEVGDPCLDSELEWTVPRHLRCFNGGVRVYLPAVNFKSDPDGARHRMFVPRRIDELGSDVVESMIARGLATRISHEMRVAVTCVEDVAALERDARLTEIRKQSSSAGTDTWVRLLEEDNSELTRKLKESEDEAECLTNALAEAEANEDDAREQVAAARHEERRLREEANRARTTIRALEDARVALRSLQKLPGTIWDALRIACSLYPTRLAWTERAEGSAKDAGENVSDVKVVWNCLMLVATELHDLHFLSESGSPNLCEAFRQSTGFELALTETKATKANKTLMALRSDSYKGKAIDITPHIKVTEGGRYLRLHYFPCPENRLIVVGHCGVHLDTAGTRRR